MDRQTIIDSLTRNGYRYNFDKYSDQQLFRIWQDKQDKISPAELESIYKEMEKERNKPKCKNCGRLLDEMGTCPVCDQGEEDYDNKIYGAEETNMADAERVIEQFASIDKMHKSFVEDIDDDIIDYDGTDRVEKFISRLQEITNYGGTLGAINSLIYYDDIDDYFNEFYDEIYDYLNDSGLDDIILDSIKSKNSAIDVLMCTEDAKRDIVWAVYEMLAGELADMLYEYR